MEVISSISRFLHKPRKEHIGILCNQASVGLDYQHSVDLLRSYGFHLTAIFSPQHGFRGEEQANMIESDHDLDEKTGLPVYSLYSATRTPEEHMLDQVDTLVCDLQDVGCRIFTFISTLINALKQTGAMGKKLVVLDRPNPIGGVEIEGNILKHGYESFVGSIPTVERHGLTMGELLLLAKDHHELQGDLEIVQMENWNRDRYFDECGLPWVYPSPNLPTITSALVYPGSCLLEGTNLSEGRGTTLPFELIGAPFINADRLRMELDDLDLDGAVFREAHFKPTFDKYKNQVCHGIQIHITDRKAYRPVLTTICLIHTVIRLYGDSFNWLMPPYEYEMEKLPFDILTGDPMIRDMLDRTVPIKEIAQYLTAEKHHFLAARKGYLLY